MFTYKTTSLLNFRCFERMDLSFESDVTILFAENGGGKSSILTALAMGLAVFQPRSPKDLKLDPQIDPRKIGLENVRQRQAVGTCTTTWKAQVGEHDDVIWESSVSPSSGRTVKKFSEVFDAIEATRLPDSRWPLFAWYGTDRMARKRRPVKAIPPTNDRWEGYSNSLDPTITDGRLLEWFEREMLADVVLHRQKQPERRLDQGVIDAMVRATPGIHQGWYDPIDRGPATLFEDGHIAPWSELSDGYHVFLALVGDIARRAIMLNEKDGANAPLEVEGVVLIDEIDLHLHPRWQRVVLDGLREAFPKLQFIVTTHSPQVLSSALNRQVRRFVDWKLDAGPILVEGRDSNAILRENMNTDDRDESGSDYLRALHDAIDRADQQTATALYESLLERWGDIDPALIRAKALMEWMD